MIVTGYKLREAINKWELKRDAEQSQFEDAKYAFKDESKEPLPHYDAWWLAENNIVALQAMQAEYNTKVKVFEGDGEVTLAHAVKLVGSAQRRVAIIKSVSLVERRGLFSYRGSPQVRDKENEYAEPTIKPDVALSLSIQAAEFLSELRGAIAAANATEVEMEVDPGLFEA